MGTDLYPKLELTAELNHQASVSLRGRKSGGRPLIMSQVTGQRPKEHTHTHTHILTLSNSEFSLKTDFDGKQSTPFGQLPRSVYSEKYVYDMGKVQEIMTCRLEK